MSEQNGRDAPTPLKREGLSGIEYVRAMMDGRIPLSGMAKTIGWRVRGVEVGKVVFSLPLGPHLHGNNGLHGGTFATLFDGAFAAAVNSSLAADQRCKTLDIRVNYIRGVTTEIPELVCTAEVLHIGRSNAFVEARIVDSEGRLCASATATFGITQIKLA
jgi:uncharacterized protein (TIGR00369 family)